MAYGGIRRAGLSMLILLLTLAMLISGCAEAGEKAKFKNETQVREKPAQLGAPQKNETEPSIPSTASANLTAGGESEKEFLELEKTHFSRAGRTKNAYWDRWWVAWGGVEREKGVYDFRYYDAVVRRAGEEGVPLLITVLPFAEWDQDRCHGDEYLGKMPMPEGKAVVKVGKPCSMEDYKEFLRALVERYDGDGVEDMPGLRYPVKYWEIMNEPAMQGRDPSGLKFFYGTPEEYLEILKASYSAIKEADPEAKVVMGGMAGMHEQFVEFWEPIMGEAGNYFDIANIHSIDTDERREDLFVLKFKRFLKKHGVEKPIWVTEAQFGPLDFELGKRKLGEEEMNRLLVRATVLSLALGAEKIFFISDNWRHRSTFLTYETLVEKLNRFDSVEVVEQRYVENYGKDASVTSVFGCYRFRVENRSIYVAWGEGRLSRCVEGKVRVTDIYGGEKTADAGEVVLTATPVYVEVLE